MWRGRRAVLIAVAWVVPLGWLAFALSAPSDGTVVSSPTAVLGDERWGDTVTVVDTYGDTPLQEGDEIRAIDGSAPTDVATGDSPGAGAVVTYRVDRPTEAGLPLRREVDVAQRVEGAAFERINAVDGFQGDHESSRDGGRVNERTMGHLQALCQHGAGPRGALVADGFFVAAGVGATRERSGFGIAGSR